MEGFQSSPPECSRAPAQEGGDGAVAGQAAAGADGTCDLELEPGMRILMGWLNSEVKVRLSDIGTKLDQVSCNIDRYLAAVEGARPPEPLPAAEARKTASATKLPVARSTMSSHQRTMSSLDLQARFMEENCPVLRGSGVSRDSAQEPYISQFSVAALGERRLKVWTIMHDQDSSLAARCYAAALRYLVWISVVVTLAQTVKPPPLRAITTVVLETIFDSVFLLEIVVRFLICPNRGRFMLSAYNIIDIVAALPLVLRASTGFVPYAHEDAESCASVCFILLYVVPIVRILKTLRTFRKFHLLLSAFELALEALPVLLFTMTVIVLIFSSMIYFVEPRANIETLPMAMYFTIITMTTVGYGDISPTTNAGHIVVALCTVTGVLYMAMPIGIIGSAFTETWQRRDRVLLTKRIRENLLQWGYTIEDIPALFDVFDADGGGELNYRGFRRMMNRMRIGLPEDRIMELFRSIDADNGGTIDAREFMRVLFPQAFHAIYEDTTSSWAGPSSNWNRLISRAMAVLRPTSQLQLPTRVIAGSGRRSVPLGLPVARAVPEGFGDMERNVVRASL